jgi:small redox-active disulfide protein 2
MLQNLETLSIKYIDTASTVSNNGNIMKIQILGTGCSKCNKLEKSVREAIASLSIDATIEKVTAVDKIVEMGVMITPALAIDGRVVSTGKVLTKEQVSTFLEG